VAIACANALFQALKRERGLGAMKGIHWVAFGVDLFQALKRECGLVALAHIL